MPIERLCCLVLAAAIVVRVLLLGQPVLPAAWGPQLGEWGHAGVYALVSALFLVGTAGRVPLMVAGAVIAVGGLEELQRMLAPGGHANLVRFVAGASAALGAAALMSLKMRKE